MQMELLQPKELVVHLKMSQLLSTDHLLILDHLEVVVEVVLMVIAQAQDSMEVVGYMDLSQELEQVPMQEVQIQQTVRLNKDQPTAVEVEVEMPQSKMVQMVLKEL
jgi:hypothetical protein